MHSALDSFVVGFWLCFIALVVYGPLTFLVIWRPHVWFRIRNAGESFLIRLGFSKRVASFGRSFSESRGFAVLMVVLTLAMLLLAVLQAACYLYFRHRLYDNAA